MKRRRYLKYIRHKRRKNKKLQLRHHRVVPLFLRRIPLDIYRWKVQGGLNYDRTQMV